MKKRIDVARALRDPMYRASLSPEEQSLVPDHPAGFGELTEAELSMIQGAAADEDTGSKPSVCMCVVTQTGTGPNCSCDCPDTEIIV